MDIISRKLKPYLPYVEKFGLQKGIALARKLYPKNSTHDLISVKLNGFEHPIWLRGGTTDVTNFNENIIHHVFPFPKNIEPKFIIDAGANAGYASIQFLNRYKDAYVIAIEPDSTNIKILNKNCQPYNRFQAIESAIWSNAGYVKIINPEAGKTGFRVNTCDQGDAGAMKATTINDVLEATTFERIDILKLDIEGAELEIFQDNYKKWIDKVDILIIELHERFKRGSALAFHLAMIEQPFVEISKGANLVYVRQS